MQTFWSAQLNRWDALEARFDKLLTINLNAADLVFKTISNELALQFRSGPHIKNLLMAVHDLIEDETEALLNELDLQRGSTRPRVEQGADVAGVKLRVHLKALTDRSGVKGIAAARGKAAVAAVNKAIREISENLEGDLQDYRKGIWRPRKASAQDQSSKSLAHKHGTIDVDQPPRSASSLQGMGEVNLKVASEALMRLEDAVKEAKLEGGPLEGILAEIDTIKAQIRKHQRR